MADLSAAREHLTENAHKALDEAMREVRNETRTSAPKRSNRLRNSIDFEDIQGGPVFTTALTADTEYAAAQDTGARPHVITPKGQGYPLVFFWPKVGSTVFRMSVQHPGNPATNFFSRPLPDRFQRALQRAIGAFS